MTLKTAFARLQTSATAIGHRAWSALKAHPWRSVALLPAVALLYVLVLIPFTPSIGDIKKAKLEHPTVVMSVDGKELATFKRANRDWVKLADMSPNLVSALIATEDKRFFDHHGMDFQRTATALVHTLKGDRQGGSTLTQQLARNLYPDDIGRAPTLTRKLKEAITALKIEAVYTKQEILETYLNTVPFLYNAYGVEMAARTYFDKPASKLDVVEAATLVGMLKGTSYYNPVLNPERSLDRRNTVMAMMVKNGKLESAQYETLKKRPLGLDFEKLPEVAGPAPHLARQLRQWLGEWAERKGYNIYADGLVVRTSVDSRVQQFANDAVKRQMERLQGQAEARRGALHGNQALVQAFVRDTPQYRVLREQGRSEQEAIRQLQGDSEFMKNLWDDKTLLEAGFMALEPGTGYVRAWVGSRDFQLDQFDHVNQARRQPGSTFKPFVYGAAFEQGMSPMQQFLDGPVEVRIDERTVWRPKDVDAPSMQMMTLRDALAQSKNTITAQLVQQVGIDRVARLAQAMGVRQSKLDVVPSLALGTSPVTLKEMVAAYGTIANSGSYVEPQVVLRIEDRKGQVLEDFVPPGAQPALSADAAHTLLDVMRGVIDSGTGVRIRNQYGITGDVAGKTGTTQNDTDGWFILMHPQLVAGAWVGFNDARVTMIHEWGQGAHSALPIVGDVVQQALRGKVIDAKAQFAAPRNKGVEDPTLLGRVGDWLGGLFGSSAPMTPQPEVAVTQPTQMPELPRVPSYEPAPRVPDASIAAAPSMATGAATAAADGGSASGTGSTSSNGATGAPSILSLGIPATPARSPMPPSVAPSPSVVVVAPPATGNAPAPARVITLPSGNGPTTITLGAGSTGSSPATASPGTSSGREVSRSDAPASVREERSTASGSAGRGSSESTSAGSSSSATSSGTIGSASGSASSGSGSTSSSEAATPATGSATAAQ